MARPVWSGTISFGLVAIPVKLFHAVRRQSVSFNQLDERNMARIRYRKVNAETGEEVGDEHIVKGYEISKGRFVVVDPDELEAVEETSGNRAKILKIRVFRKGMKRPELSLDIPWALADLALSAIPAEEREEMREEGYDLDKIIRELTEVKGNIISIQSDEKLFRIWIE